MAAAGAIQRRHLPDDSIQCLLVKPRMCSAKQLISPCMLWIQTWIHHHSFLFNFHQSFYCFYIFRLFCLAFLWAILQPELAETHQSSSKWKAIYIWIGQYGRWEGARLSDYHSHNINDWWLFRNKMSMLIIVGVPALAPLFFDALCFSLYWTRNKVETQQVIQIPLLVWCS